MRTAVWEKAVLLAIVLGLFQSCPSLGANPCRAKHQLKPACCSTCCPPAALQAADVIVAIAGVDSALPGVLSGLVDAPIIAVPTSNAANNGLQGIGNLVAAVSSCAPGVSVVNIDGTVNAAVMCAKMLRVAAARVEKLQAAAATAAQQHENGSGNGQYNNIVPKFAPAQVPAQPAAV